MSVLDRVRNVIIGADLSQRVYAGVRQIGKKCSIESVFMDMQVEIGFGQIYVD